MDGSKQIQMVSHDRFGQMRLSAFLPDAELEQLEDWQFMGHEWVGEALGFSEWLRLAAAPESLGSLAIDFEDFPDKVACDILKEIGLPVRQGMAIEDLRSLLGSPVGEERFVSDRISYEFVITGPPKYDVSCTVLNDGGLTYLVVMKPLPDDGG